MRPTGLTPSSLGLRRVSALLSIAALVGCSMVSLDNLSNASSSVEETASATSVSSSVGAGGEDATATGSGGAGSGGAGSGGAGSGGAGSGGAGSGEGGSGEGGFALTSAGTGGTGGGGGSGGGDAGCPADATHTAVVRDGSCYRRSRVPATWFDARDRCEDLGGGAHLATLTTTSELGVHALLYPADCVPPDEEVDDGEEPCDERAFVGASFEGDLGAGPWEWVTGEAWTWPFFVDPPWVNEDEPNAHHLALWVAGKLDGRPNDKTLPYICESAIE